MTTTAMMKTKVAVADPTISGSCSCHGFGGSALEVKERKWLTGELVAKIYPQLLHSISTSKKAFNYRFVSDINTPCLLVFLRNASVPKANEG